MEQKWTFLGGIAVGAAVMFVLEPALHQDRDRMPALERRRRRAGLSSWSPAARLLASVAAGTVAVLAMAKRVA
jgi:hypothetical protein